MKILIVDDSKTMRRILKSGIEKSCDMDLEILEAEDGKVGLEVARKNKDIDYIFLDVNMPVMKGDEMLRILRGEEGIKDIPVIMQTTEGAKEMVITLTKLGIAGYLLKPYTQDIVRDLMSKLIEHAEA